LAIAQCSLSPVRKPRIITRGATLFLITPADYLVMRIVIPTKCRRRRRRAADSPCHHIAGIKMDNNADGARSCRCAFASRHGQLTSPANDLSAATRH
jgi:hypothetical protein